MLHSYLYCREELYSVSSLNYGNFQVSIHSGAKEEICNEELFILGLEQLQKRLKEVGVPKKEIRKLYRKFRSCHTTEDGFKVLSSKEEVEKKFVLGKWYPLGNRSIQFDESHGKLELDVRYNPNRSDMRDFNLIQDFNLYKKLDSKGIMLINSFSLEPNSPSKSLIDIGTILTDKKDDIIENKDKNELSELFYVPIYSEREKGIS